MDILYALIKSLNVLSHSNINQETARIAIMKKALIFFLLVCLPGISFSKTAEVKLFLTEIKCLKPSEAKGDEVYFSISEKIEGIDEKFDRVEHQTPFYP